MHDSRLDPKRIAIVFTLNDQKIVVRGLCRWTDDVLLGRVLQVIDVDDPSSESAILLQMHVLQSAIEPGGAYGCDYSLSLDRPPGTEREVTGA